MSASEQPDLDELVTVYINSKRGKDKADKTFNGYQYSLRRFKLFLDDCDLHYSDIDKETNLAPEMESIDTSDISDNNLLDYFILWLINEAEYAKSTTQTTYNYTQPFIEFLRSEGYIEYDATDETDLSEYLTYGATRQMDEWDDDYIAVDEDQFEVMRESVEAPKFRNRVILSLLYGCGLRRGEVAELKLGNIDLSNRHITVPAVKTDESRDVWFSPSVKTNLEIWMKAKRDAYLNSDSDFLFVTNDSRSKGGISPKRVSKIVQTAADALDDQEYFETQNGHKRAKYSAHSLRHGFAEKFIANSGDGESSIYELKEILGHSSVSVTERYLESEKNEFLRSQMERYGPQL